MKACHFIFYPAQPFIVGADLSAIGVSIRNLFGNECSATVFRHDAEMRELHAKIKTQVVNQQTGTTVNTQPSQMSPPSPRQIMATSQRRSAGLTIRRNSQGLLRPFDAEGRELHPPLAVLENLPGITPPREILATSPGSDSQSLRRKAILEGLREGRDKRARLQFDGPDSSPTLESVERDEAVLREVDLSTESQHSDASSHANTPGSEAAGAKELGRKPFSAFRDENGQEIICDEMEYDGDNMTLDKFYDPEDEVDRCKLCGHELWRPYIGFCTGCKRGQSGVPYFEIIDPENGPRPRIELNEYAPDINLEDRRDIVGDYLDDHSSAYDSQDANVDLHEDYEINSFIDDTPKEASNDENDASSSDGETLYKERYHELEERYNTLLNNYENLEDEYFDFRRDVLGSDYGSDRSGFDEIDEDGLLVVDVSVPDPVVTELVLSQAQEQSQDSQISDDRVRDRVLAFEAAINDDGRGWRNISLVSTTDNHTHEEIEL
jgi:hypothetical protein